MYAPTSVLTKEVNVEITLNSESGKDTTTNAKIMKTQGTDAVTHSGRVSKPVAHLDLLKEKTCKLD